ncbi:hypothetical protein QQ045_022319 [Rhodiola kirilowii]
MPYRLGRHCHVNVDPRTSIPEGVLKSVLFIEGVVEGDREQVPIVRVIKGHFINFRHILEHTLKAKVEKVIVRGAILPVPHLKYKNVIEAESHHLAPKDLVVFGNREYDNVLCHHLPFTDNDEIKCLPLYCRLLNEVWTNRHMFVIDVDQNVFGDDFGITVTTYDLKELFKLAALGNFACELFICSLYNEMMGWDIKFGFFNPSIMTSSINRDERLMTFVAKLSMSDQDHNFCYFLPYVDHVKVYRYYQGCIPRNTQSVHWKVLECPKQPPGHLCGYYVLNFIRDIIHFIRTNNGAKIDDLSQCFPNGRESCEDSKIEMK